MIRLSVNINKIATLRNARGGNLPDVLKVAVDCERFGAQGITVHPRPDERHIRYRDVRNLKPILSTDFNIEGYPSKKFLDLVMEVKPIQATMVPDPPNALTSSEGWNTIKHKDFLKDVIEQFHSYGIRTSIFIGTDPKMIEEAAKTNSDRVELYTEPYAAMFPKNPGKAVEPFVNAAKVANQCGLEINAGHDLNLDNLGYFVQNVPYIIETSIGHALICDSLYYGLENTIQLYLRQLNTQQT